MPKPRTARLPPDQLRQRLAALGAERLAGFLVEWSAQDDRVARAIDFLAREGDVAAQADALREELNTFKRRRSFYSRRESGAWADTLRRWLQRVDALGERAPEQALPLLDAYIRADGRLIESGDDSDGLVGSVIEEGCVLWLKAAKACGLSTREAIRRVVALADRNDYGARELLLACADRLFDADGLRQLAAHYEHILATHAPRDDYAEDDPGRNASICLGQVARAQRNPDTYLRAVLWRSPNPNELQRLDIAQACFDFGHPDRALEWLPERVEHRHAAEEREALLDDILAAQGNRQALLEHRLQRLERAPSVAALDAALEVAAPETHAAIRAQAHQFARDRPHVEASIELLLKLGDRAAAEQRLHAQRDQLRDWYYAALLRLVDLGREAGSAAIQVLALRALLLGIVEPGRSPLYRHAARYLHALRLLAADYHPPEGDLDHAAFEARLRADHARKRMFWAAVDAG
jgi:hypothetical protein